MGRRDGGLPRGRYDDLSPLERVRLMLRAEARDDHHESDRLRATTPRASYKSADPTVVDLYNQVWRAAYAFRDAYFMLEHGVDLGARQVLAAARFALTKEDYERVMASWKSTQENLKRVTRDELKRTADEGPVPDGEMFQSEYLNLFCGHYDHQRMRALLVAGLRAYSEFTYLTIEEVLAPLPFDQREELMAKIKILPNYVDVPENLAMRSAEALAGERLYDTDDTN